MNDNEMKRKKEILKVKNIEDYSDQQIESDDLKQLEKQFDQKLKCLKDTHKYQFIRDNSRLMPEKKYSDEKNTEIIKKYLLPKTN